MALSWSLVLVFVPLAYGNLLAPLDRGCTSRGTILKTQILRNYFSGQMILNVVQVGETFPTVALSCLNYPMLTYFHTIERFREDTRYIRKYVEVVKHIHEYPSDECFLSSGALVVLTEQLLPSLADRNPQGKFVIITDQLSADQLVQVFDTAWYRYRLLNVLLLNRHLNGSVESCLFNPFVLSDKLTNSDDLFCRLVVEEDEVANYNAEVNRFTELRIRDLNGYPLHVAMHVSHGSSSAYDCIVDFIHFTDIDQEIFGIMQQHMNFTAVLHQSDLEMSIGYVYPNGTAVGALGLIEKNQIDLAVNSRIIHNYETPNLLYLHYITTEKLLFVVPSNYYGNRDKLLIFLSPFSIVYMLLNVGFSFGISICVYFMERARVRRDLPAAEQRITSFSKRVLSIMGIIYNVSVPLPQANYKRYIIFGLLVYNIVTYPIWQGVAIRHLNSNDQYLNNINSLEELLESDLTLKVSLYHEHVVRHEGTGFEKATYRALSERLTTRNTSSLREAIEMIIVDRNSAFLIVDSYIPLILAGSYKWIPGKPNGLYVIGEPIYEFYKSMAVPKTSPFIRTLNAIVLNCIEAGLNERTLRQLATVVQLIKIQQVKEHAVDDEARLFDMESLFPLFVFYAVMMAVASAVFVGELLVKRFLAEDDSKQEDEYVPFEFVL